MNFKFSLNDKNAGKKTVGVVIFSYLGSVAGWLICTALLMWGWSVIAPHLNAPLFSYWECFAIYCGLRAVGGALFKKS